MTAPLWMNRINLGAMNDGPYTAYLLFYQVHNLMYIIPAVQAQTGYCLLDL